MTLIPYASPVEPPPDFKDARTGLRVIGVIEIVLGSFCGLIVLAALLVTVPRVARGMSDAEIRDRLATVLLSAALAAFFIWIGIGSCLARRWARAMMLAVAGPWLVMGLMQT